jgi:hypothetical protein
MERGRSKVKRKGIELNGEQRLNRSKGPGRESLE